MHFLSKKSTFSLICTVFVRFLSKKSSIFAPVMNNIPTVTRYLLIGNLIAFLLTQVLSRYGIDLNTLGGLHYITASSFHWWQPVTYMFLHANWSHIFFNMFAVWMFAPLLEREWGAQRFLIYYLVCGLGAAAVQEGVWSLMLANLGSHYGEAAIAQYAFLLNTIGASGAVFGILFAFGWLFPNVPMFLLFIPIPIRARVFVIIYALIELFMGLGSVIGFSSDNVAHFAHLGGMLFGWLLLLWWRHNNWQEPEWWQNLKDRRHSRLDSTDDRYNDYHYHKRV